ncbi:SDR family NAD(P)-dependent oxidoreductase [Nocardioides stalactiti]|uniref:SDR family NAD(P)-dependent oxidoreductase n=1 Tax=Nocardioides stalactiti TaxID=2755356 RepID=UPI001603DBF5|nr:SDR family NAD(P)-dependent oxidoreductase [Nocardioides stalactiti]
MNYFSTKVAAVTGAASGIGRSLAINLAGQGCALALSDIDGTGLAETEALCRSGGSLVTSDIVDVASRSAMHEWADSVVSTHGKVNMIFNNAGVALGSTVETMTWDDMDWLMNINFWGVIHGTKAFLPYLIQSGEGHVVNVSSVFGLVSIPTQSAYNASKFGVRGFTDALYMELKAARHPVSATTVHPGGIKTNIVKNARLNDSLEIATAQEAAHSRFQTIAMTSPDRAARIILRAVRGGRRRVTVGPDAKAIDLLSRLPSPLYQKVLVLGARRELA